MIPTWIINRLELRHDKTARVENASTWQSSDCLEHKSTKIESIMKSFSVRRRSRPSNYSAARWQPVLVLNWFLLLLPVSSLNLLLTIMIPWDRPERENVLKLSPRSSPKTEVNSNVELPEMSLQSDNSMSPKGKGFDTCWTVQSCRDIHHPSTAIDGTVCTFETRKTLLYVNSVFALLTLGMNINWQF